MRARYINNNYCFFVKLFSKSHLLCRQRYVHASAESYSVRDQDSEKDNDIPTMMEVRKRFMKIRGVKRGFLEKKEDLSYLLQYLPNTQEELPPRSVKDSLQKAVIPLSTHPELQDKYVNPFGYVRSGRLVEELDMFSDWVAMNYVVNPRQPEDSISSYAMVTVRVDEITFTDYQAHSSTDVLITGYVSGVGKTTIETTIWMDQSEQGVYHRITKAVFLMAARNATLTGGAIVNPLVPADEEEKVIVAAGEARRGSRTRVEGPFLYQFPNLEEQEIIHKLFLESRDKTISDRVLPPGSVWMTNTRRRNNIFSFPEDRNYHNTVFGGFTMRHAAEMAWFTGYFHCKEHPKLRAMSDISFKHPVNLGSILSFTGYVVYTEGKLMQIFVHADVSNPPDTNVVTSVVFYFTYESPVPIKCVTPNTYYEAMMYIDGRRHFMEVQERDKKAHKEGHIQNTTAQAP